MTAADGIDSIAGNFAGQGEGRTTPEAGQKDVLVKFRDVRKTYGDRVIAVDDLNLEVRRGEFLTLLGPSGSGKTTTLMMLAGFEDVTQGEIVLDGRHITQVPAHKRNIGVVFQQYALFPHMTVAQNLAYPLRTRRVGKAEIETRIEKMLDMVQLPGFGERRPSELSGGQQQRVALARALIFEPEVILMDEPLGALDKRLRDDMQLEIKHLHERLELTIVYVTHDQTEALVMSDTIAVFDQGRIQQLSSPKKLYTEPESSFVAGFVGESNRLHGTVDELSGDYCRVKLDSGDNLEARAIKVDGTGSRTSVAIRPEAVRINPKSDVLENRFDGQVIEVIYLGNRIGLRIDTCRSNEFVAEIQPSGDHQHPVTGDRVTVAWASKDCRALDFLP